MGQKNIGCIMVEARKFDLSKDYAIIYRWWRAHGSFPPEPEHLSGTGIVVEADGKPVCAGFLYKTDSKICVFEFVVSDPSAKKQTRCDALNHLIKIVQDTAKELNFNLIYTSINIEAYIRKLADAGFVAVDTNQTHMFCKLGEKDE